MSNTDSRNCRDSVSQTTRSSFTPLFLINKAITDSQRHNYELITQNNRFSLSTLHACFTRIPPQITTTPISPSFAVCFSTVNPLHSLNTAALTCTYTTCKCAHTDTPVQKLTQIYAKGYWRCHPLLPRAPLILQPSRLMATHSSISLCAASY